MNGIRTKPASWKKTTFGQIHKINRIFLRKSELFRAVMALFRGFSNRRGWRCRGRDRIVQFPGGLPQMPIAPTMALPSMRGRHPEKKRFSCGSVDRHRPRLF